MDKKSDQPHLAAIGIKRKGEKGFKINSTLDKSSVPDKPTAAPIPKTEPHLIHDGTGVSCCSVCGYPVNIPTGSCGTCSCGAQFGGCG